jgi:hypothetical protein
VPSDLRQRLELHDIEYLVGGGHRRRRAQESLARWQALSQRARGEGRQNSKASQQGAPRRAPYLSTIHLWIPLSALYFWLAI